ncbi:GntR family transcriptional regulator [Cellulomonas sp. P24]|nr:GntR family transcriptional regulator [Cellulomonas sp. P24]
MSPRALERLLGGWHRTGPAYTALADAVRAALLAGSLPLSTRLPSERELAVVLGLSRTTTSAAYQLLRDEGFLVSRRGSGTITTLPRRTSPRRAARRPASRGPTRASRVRPRTRSRTSRSLLHPRRPRSTPATWPPSTRCPGSSPDVATSRWAWTSSVRPSRGATGSAASRRPATRSS